jgi:hypothetical protein
VWTPGSGWSGGTLSGSCGTAAAGPGWGPGSGARLSGVPAFSASAAILLSRNTPASKATSSDSCRPASVRGGESEVASADELDVIDL